MGSVHQKSSHFLPLGTRAALKPAYFSRVSGPATHVDTLGRLSESWGRPSQIRLIPSVADQKLASLAQKREPSRTSIIPAVPLTINFHRPTMWWRLSDSWQRPNREGCLTHSQRTTTSCSHHRWRPRVTRASRVSLFTLLDHMSSAVPGVNRHHASLTVH